MKLLATVFGGVVGGLLFRNPLGVVLGAATGLAFDQGWFKRRRPQEDALERAYSLLGESAKADDETLALAYRRKISQYHPDKLGQAAPEIIRLAEERTRELNLAWSLIQKSRHGA